MPEGVKASHDAEIGARAIVASARERSTVKAPALDIQFSRSTCDAACLNSCKFIPRDRTRRCLLIPDGFGGVDGVDRAMARVHVESPFDGVQQAVPGFR